MTDKMNIRVVPVEIGANNPLIALYNSDLSDREKTEIWRRECLRKGGERMV